MSDLTKRYRLINDRIKSACDQANRNVVEIQLIAVSKNFSQQAIAPLLAAGHRHFGENRVQEAAQKWPALRLHYPQIHLALIGPLQSNKISKAVSLFDGIYSVDREKIASVIAKEMFKQEKSLDLMVQINIGYESQKTGILPDDAENFVIFCVQDLKLKISGLMCIPPVGEQPQSYFSDLKKIQTKLKLPLLSMGMSADFEQAIKHGATHIRVGSALFGSRQ